MKIKERLKKVEKLFEQLKDSNVWIFVEGKKDKHALKELGLDEGKILTISGNLRLSCRRLEAEGAEKVFVLTDLDRRGDELALKAKDELEAGSIRADLSMRQDLAHLLKVRNFEDARRAYEKIKEENEREEMG